MMQSAAANDILPPYRGKEWEFYPLASIFPQMAVAEFGALVEDIRRHGLQKPGLTCDGKLLDGRARYRACRELGVPFRTEAYTGSAPFAELLRRHIKPHHTPSQRALLATTVVRLSRGLRSKRATKLTLRDAAVIVGVSERLMKSASRLLTEASVVEQAKVRAGRMTIHAALKTIADPS